MPATAVKKNSNKTKTIKKTTPVNKTWTPIRSSASFNGWWSQFVKCVRSNPANFGFTKPQAAAFIKFWNTWHNAFAAHQSISNAWGAKPSTRKPAAPKSKPARKPAVKPKTTRNGTTNYWMSKTWIPKFSFDWSKKGRCTIFFGTNPGTRTNKFANNANKVCLQFRIGTGSWKTLTTTNKTSFIQIVSTSAPKSLQYRACYINAQGKKGPWNTTSPFVNKIAA